MRTWILSELTVFEWNKHIYNLYTSCCY